MKKEYVLVLIIGLFLTAYVLEAIVQPLTLDLATPYHYIDAQYLSTYPFTTTVIIVRAVAALLTPILLFSFIEKKYGLKAGLTLVIAALSQLYVLQELATNNQILPLEWALSIALAGLALLPMIVVYLVKAGLSSAHTALTKDSVKTTESTEDEQ